MSKDKITIDDLAGMVQRGFLEQNQQIQRLQEDVTELKDNVSVLNDNVHDLQLVTNRIETLQKSELSRADEHTLALNNHEKRILKLEKSKA
jgi:hypothetical protein